jgi:hypothetical protein
MILSLILYRILEVEDADTLVRYIVVSCVAFVYKISAAYDIKMFHFLVTASAYAQGFGPCDEWTSC